MPSTYLVRLKSLRMERGLSQKDVAHVLHISQRTYSDYESGRVRLQAEKILLLARFYDVSADYLCGLTDVRGPFPAP